MRQKIGGVALSFIQRIHPLDVQRHSPTGALFPSDSSVAERIVQKYVEMSFPA
jgi:hypothetical protein